MFGDDDGAPADSEGDETLGESGIEDPAAGLVPSIDPPTPDVDTDPATPAEDVDTGDVDRETYAVFWRLVVVMDVALLALALGPMFVYFEGDWRRGGALFGLGVVAAGYGVRTYRAFRDDDRTDQSDDAEESDRAEESDDADESDRVDEREAAEQSSAGEEAARPDRNG